MVITGCGGNTMNINFHNKFFKILAAVIAAALLYVAYLEKQRYHAAKITQMYRETAGYGSLFYGGRKGLKSSHDDDYLGI